MSHAGKKMVLHFIKLREPVCHPVKLLRQDSQFILPFQTDAALPVSLGQPARPLHKLADGRIQMRGKGKRPENSHDKSGKQHKPAVAYNSDAVLYGVGLDNNLYTIDTATAALTLVGAMGTADIVGIEFVGACVRLAVGDSLGHDDVAVGAGSNLRLRLAGCDYCG